MNEPKFTNGPWFTDPDADLMACEPCVYAQGPEPLFELDITIATVTAYHARLSREETKANAALISAAPEMYVILQKILNINIIPDYQAHIAQDIICILQKARGEA